MHRTSRFNHRTALAAGGFHPNPQLHHGTAGASPDKPNGDWRGRAASVPRRALTASEAMSAALKADRFAGAALCVRICFLSLETVWVLVKRRHLSTASGSAGSTNGSTWTEQRQQAEHSGLEAVDLGGRRWIRKMLAGPARQDRGGLVPRGQFETAFPRSERERTAINSAPLWPLCVDRQRLLPPQFALGHVDRSFPNHMQLKIPVNDQDLGRYGGSKSAVAQYRGHSPK